MKGEGLRTTEAELRRELAASLRRMRGRIYRKPRRAAALAAFDAERPAVLKTFGDGMEKFIRSAERYAAGKGVDNSAFSSKAAREDANKRLQRTREELGPILGLDDKERRSGLGEALDATYRGLSLAARQHVYGQLRDSITEAAKADEYRSWVWVARLDHKTCPVCWAMHGTEHKPTTKMVGHLMCRCHPELVSKGESREVTGIDLFDRLPEAEKLRILGSGKYRLYKQGKLILTDLIGRKNHVQYGPRLYERPLKRLV